MHTERVGNFLIDFRYSCCKEIVRRCDGALPHKEVRTHSLFVHERPSMSSLPRHRSFFDFLARVHQTGESVSMVPEGAVRICLSMVQQCDFRVTF